MTDPTASDGTGAVTPQLPNIVETKVKVGTATATGTSLIAALVGLYFFHGTVPDWLTVIVEAAVTGVLTFFAAYRAKHTPRPPV